MAMALLMSLVACQTTEILDQRQDSRINLRTSVNTATKAVGLSTNHLKTQGFHLAVFQGKIGDADVVKYFEMDMDRDQFKEDGYYTPYFWEDRTLHFYAWYPKSEQAGTMTVDPDNGYAITYAPAENAAEQKDFSVAYNIGTKEENGSSGVNMNFRHALSQVEIIVNNASTLADNNVIVKAVKVGNAIKSGTFGMPVYPTDEAVSEENRLTGLWSGNVRTNSGDKNLRTYSIVHDSPITIIKGQQRSVMGAAGNWMVVPQVNSEEQFWNPEEGGAGDKMYMALLVKLMQGSATVYPSASTPEEDKVGDYAWTAVPIPAGSVLEAGKKYTFTLTFIINTGNAGNRISDGKEILSHPIKLVVTVDDWVEVSNGETLY